MIYKILLLPFLTASLVATTGCGTINPVDRPNFNRMSDAEIEQYNASVPSSQRVTCQESNSTSSRISRRVCTTPAEQLNNSKRAVDKIVTTNI